MARPAGVVGPGDRENLLFFRVVKAGFLLDLGGPPRPLSFVDVEDCARGLLELAESPAAPGEAFFLASAERTDLSSLQRQAARALGVSPRTIPVPASLLSALAWAADGVTLVSGLKSPLNRKLARQLLAPGWTCDPGKARRLLGFEARVSLDESVDRAARWYRENGWL